VKEGQTGEVPEMQYILAPDMDFGMREKALMGGRGRKRGEAEEETT
jgi:hypothetical protein